MQSQLKIDFKPTATTDTTDRILQEIGIPGITGIFQRVGIAEQLIKQYQKKYPGKSEQIWNSFKILCPPAAFKNKSDRLYRQHVKELLERVATGQDIRPATRPEILLALSEISKAAPMRHDAAVAFQRLFNECFPDKKQVPELAPSWDGAARQVIEEIRDKIKTDR